MLRTRGLLGLLSIGALLATAPSNCGGPQRPPRLDPLRLYSIGDSITTGFDSWFIGNNDAVSWANGFHGFWEDLFGIPDIDSFNQRITASYGSSGRANVMAAANGARWDDALGQALGVAGEAPTLVTVLLGGNDVCRDEIADLPTDAEIQSHVRTTLSYLHSQLPAGATVQVAGIPDIKLLHDVGLAEKGLLGIDCTAIWATTALGFPCGSMLSPDNTEADRLYVQSRNFAYNDIIEAEVERIHRLTRRVYFHFTDAESVAFTGDDISSIDCFHPSADGQALIAEVGWSDGPFGP